MRELVCNEKHFPKPDVAAFCGGFVDDSNCALRDQLKNTMECDEQRER